MMADLFDHSALMTDGQAHQDAGRYVLAEAAFNQILAEQPDNAEALHAMGILSLQTDKLEPAVQFLARSLRIRYNKPGGFANLCLALRRLGRFQEAITAGTEAVLIAPNLPAAHNNLAGALLDSGAFAAAIAPLQRFIELVPDGTEQRLQLAIALIACHRYGEAEPLLRALRREMPNDGRVEGNLGVVLKNQGRVAEAVLACRRALLLLPGEAGVLNNYGLALTLYDATTAEAAVWLRRAVAMQPNYGDAWMNLGLVLRNLNRTEEAIAHCRTAIRHDPDHAEAHTLLATHLLLRGDLTAGFREYEWRWKLSNFPGPTRVRTTPVWDGSDPAGRTLLLYDEQGLGDSIQFARYARLLRRRGARIIFECNDPLVRLFAGLTGVDKVVGRSGPESPHDVHVPLLSLPHRLGTDVNTIPAEIPYLHAEPELVAEWGVRLGTAIASAGCRLRVGLIWAGNPSFKDDRRRSPGLEPLLPLLDVPGVAFFALQKGGGRADLERLHHRLGPAFTDLGPDIGDFADTAAIMTNLDLVISSCTGPAHLAGALGRPVWTILPTCCDWRWLEQGETSPWYPTMTLFRQDKPGDWGPVVARVRLALEAAVRANVPGQ
jgi:Flp pilus assembly protein TadD